ncbi:hypothetical protein GY45DRAFT_1439664 [Cubamyces sp. BRFM 1775]|nr:hypothetical protein GY45DRAFT_1439664 [Cubamyces sp. BRFM 1775]
MWRILRSPHDSTVPIPITRRFALARRVAEAIVQSAAIYTVASAALLITYSARQDDGYLACLNVFPSLIGLVFSLIVLRLAKRRPATQNLESTWWHARISRRPSAGDGNTPRLPIPGCSGPPLTPPLHIHLSRLSFSSDTLPVAVNEPRSVASLDKPLVLDRLQ